MRLGKYEFRALGEAYRELEAWNPRRPVHLPKGRLQLFDLLLSEVEIRAAHGIVQIVPDCVHILAGDEVEGADEVDSSVHTDECISACIGACVATCIGACIATCSWRSVLCLVLRTGDDVLKRCAC